MIELAWPLVALFAVLASFVFGMVWLRARLETSISRADFEKELSGFRARISAIETNVNRLQEQTVKLDARFPSLPTDMSLPMGLRRMR